MEINLTNKVAIVTASTDGIGLDIALTLAKNNAKVYLASRNKEKALNIINKYKELSLHFVYFDPTNEESLYSFIDDVISIEKRIDLLVNNFGTTDLKVDLDILHTNPEEYFKIINLNIKATYIPCHQVIKYMSKQKFGNIINIASVAGNVPDFTRIAYTTSKSLIINLTKNIALQVGKDNIRCNCILPGMINTNAVAKNLTEDFKKTFLSTLTIKRLGETSDIANATLFLASDLSSYITGQEITVSGGFNLGTPLFAFFNDKNN